MKQNFTTQESYYNDNDNFIVLSWQSHSIWMCACMYLANAVCWPAMNTALQQTLSLVNLFTGYFHPTEKSITFYADVSPAFLHSTINCWFISILKHRMNWGRVVVMLWRVESTTRTTNRVWWQAVTVADSCCFCFDSFHSTFSWHSRPISWPATDCQSGPGLHQCWVDYIILLYNWNFSCWKCSTSQASR